MTDNSSETSPTDDQNAAAAAPVTVDIGVSSNAPQELIDRITAMAEDLDHLGIDVTLALIRTCRVCGCTDERACLGGCWWIDDQDDVCSSCAPFDGSAVEARARFTLLEGSERGADHPCDAAASEEDELMDQSKAIPLGVVGRGRGVYLKAIIADRLHDAQAVEFDPSSADQYGDLVRRLSAARGTEDAVDQQDEGEGRQP